MAPKTPAEYRQSIRRIADRRAAADRAKAEADDALAALIPAAREAGLGHTEIAELLGIGRQSLYEFMERRGITR